MLSKRIFFLMWFRVVDQWIDFIFKTLILLSPKIILSSTTLSFFKSYVCMHKTYIFFCVIFICYIVYTLFRWIMQMEGICY